MAMIRKECDSQYIVGIYLVERLSPRLWAVSTDRSGTLSNHKSLAAAYRHLTGEPISRRELDRIRKA